MKKYILLLLLICGPLFGQVPITQVQPKYFGNGTTTIDTGTRSGADAAAQIANCLATSGVKTCDATASVAPTFAAALSIPSHTSLKLGNYIITCSVAPCIKYGEASDLQGASFYVDGSTGTVILFNGQLNNTYPIATIARDSIGTVTVTFSPALSSAPLISTLVLVQGVPNGGGGTSFDGPKGTGFYTVCGLGTSTCVNPTTSAVSLRGSIGSSAETVDSSTGGAFTITTPLIAPAVAGSSGFPKFSNFYLTRGAYNVGSSPAGLVRTSNIVTVTPAVPLIYALIPGQIIGLISTTSSGTSFNGLWNVCGTGSGCSAPTTTSFQFLQTAADATGGGGALFISDGAMGFDFAASSSVVATSIGEGGFDVGVHLGNTNIGTYYSNFYNDVFWSNLSCAVCIGLFGNSNNFYSPLVWPVFDSAVIYFDPSSTKNTFYSVDEEGGNIGQNYIAGRSNEFYSPYVEGLDSPNTVIDPQSDFITAIGGIGMNIQDNSSPWVYNILWEPGVSTTSPGTPNLAGYPKFFASKYLGTAASQYWTAQATVAALIPSIPRAIGSCSRTSNVVTCVTTGAALPGFVTGFPAASIGQQITISGTAPVGATNFNGDFNICGPVDNAGCAAPSGTTISFLQTAANDTSSGGQVDFTSYLTAQQINFSASGPHSYTSLKPNFGDSGSDFFLPPNNSQITTLAGTGHAQAGDISLLGGSVPSAPVITPTCAASCTNTWTYKIVANYGLGSSAASTAGSTIVGAANVDGSGNNRNLITWAPATGAISYSIYLTAFPGGANCGGVGCATGLLGTTPASFSSYLAFTHSTQNGDSSTAPTVNTAGSIKLAGSLTVARAISNGITTATNTDNRGTIVLSGGNGSYTFTQGPGASGVWTTAPVCEFFDTTTSTNAIPVTVTNSTITITGGTGTDHINYHCDPGT